MVRFVTIATSDIPEPLQTALDLSRELSLLGSALLAERSYLDQLADLVAALDPDPRLLPASLALRIRASTRRVNELVEQRQAILDELAGHSERGISTTVLVRVYCDPDLATNPEGSDHDRSEQPSP